jgi:hypothetical protein
MFIETAALLRLPAVAVPPRSDFDFSTRRASPILFVNHDRYSERMGGRSGAARRGRGSKSTTSRAGAGSTWSRSNLACGWRANRRVDALRLIAILIADWDKREANQRLLCLG